MRRVDSTECGASVWVPVGGRWKRKDEGNAVEG